MTNKNWNQECKRKLLKLKAHELSSYNDSFQGRREELTSLFRMFVADVTVSNVCVQSEACGICLPRVRTMCEHFVRIYSVFVVARKVEGSFVESSVFCSHRNFAFYSFEDFLLQVFVPDSQARVVVCLVVVVVRILFLGSKKNTLSISLLKKHKYSYNILMTTMTWS